MKTALLGVLFALAAYAQKRLPLPIRIMTAQTVFIDNQTGVPTAGDGAFQETVKWGRIGVVTDRKLADIVFLLTRRLEGAGGLMGGTVVYFDLAVIDPATGNELWKDSKLERIRALGVNPVRQDIDELRKRIDEQEKVTSPHRSSRRRSIRPSPLIAPPGICRWRSAISGGVRQ